MRNRWLLRIVLVVASLAGCALGCTSLGAEAKGGPVLLANGDHFELDGKRLQIISGAIHYERVPRAYWRDRLKKARAMGLNTVETYVFWNVHEPRPGEYDFSGQYDVAEFIREAQEEGLYVILRPGPYACAEWEFGGYPAWLLKDPRMEVRSRNAAFMQAATRWLRRLGKELAPLQSGLGGPILAVQVENEYGSYGSDHEYMEEIHKALLDAGFTSAMLYTADGAGEIENGSLPELPVGLNFGPGSAKEQFAMLEKKRPNVPHFCSEWWDGWFDHWGERHHTSDAKKEAEELEWMLEQGYSVNLYMFHGGTSFGWMAGANIDGGKYEPTVTSYDYDVPVSESGELRPKYFVFRDIIRRATGITPPEPPEAMEKAMPEPIRLNGAVAVWDALPKAVESEKILSMEDLGQSYGYILYRTTVEKPQTGELKVEDVHSYAQVYVDGVLAGTLDRRLNQNALTITTTHANARLDILVENSGRVNFGPEIPHERAGITKQVSLAGEVLKGWKIYPLPMDGVSGLAYKAHGCEGACFYRGTFKADAQADTFLDTRGLGKGVVFLNGKALGRFWKIGPQGTLYVTGPWLKKGENEVVVFDLEGKGATRLGFLGRAVLDGGRE